ncbi:MAG: undecaprenyl-diphosphate phosphatase [Saccharospirillaceae bacterium]|nr:undecaprenyl-diphosphate phosphatase [Pseudomonadales bacterium]NRB79565.1 undecaprenyl-diphosphate phosphatase [Saccharospirillaceae bacterium]
MLETIILGIIQGITEFLPISSSGHLILPEILFGFRDEGLSFMVAVHVGSLLAVIIYFFKDISLLVKHWCLSLVKKPHDKTQSTLAWWVIIATIPAGLAGLLLKDIIEIIQGNEAVMILIISASMGFFGLLLWWADIKAKKNAQLEIGQDEYQLTFKQTMIIGFAQALALIPGTSRSGITMTAALALGLTRKAASRFSFLLSIPLIVAAGLLLSKDLIEEPSNINWDSLLLGTLVSAVSAYLCIHLFLKWIEKIGFLPFVIYRLILSVILLVFGLQVLNA